MPNDTKYIVNGAQLTDIGAAIRSKLGEQDTYTVDEMPRKISEISGGGGSDFPVPYCKINFINGDAYYDFGAGYMESGFYIGTVLLTPGGTNVSFYSPETNYPAYTYLYPDGLVLAEKDGGTATVYVLNDCDTSVIPTLNFLFAFYTPGTFNITISNTDNVTVTDIPDMKLVQLTDITKNGECTITVSTGGR